MPDEMEQLKEKSKRNFFMVEKKFAEIEEAVDSLKKKEKKTSVALAKTSKELEKKLDKEALEEFALEKSITSLKDSMNGLKKELSAKIVSLEQGVRETAVNAEQISKLNETVTSASVDLIKMRDKLTKDYKALKRLETIDVDGLFKKFEEAEMNQIEVGKKMDEMSAKVDGVRSQFDNSVKNFESRVKKDLRGIVKDEFVLMKNELKEETTRVTEDSETIEAKQLDLAMHMDRLSQDVRSTIDSQLRTAVEKFSDRVSAEMEGASMGNLDVARKVEELSGEIQNMNEKMITDEKMLDFVEKQVESKVSPHAEEIEATQMSMLDAARSVKDVASNIDLISRQIQQINARMDDIGRVKAEDVNAVMREQFEKFTQTLDKTFSHYPTREEIKASIDSYQRQWTRQELDTLQSLANSVKRMDEHIRDMHGLVTNFSRRLPVVIE